VIAIETERCTEEKERVERWEFQQLLLASAILVEAKASLCSSQYRASASCVSLVQLLFRRPMFCRKQICRLVVEDCKRDVTKASKKTSVLVLLRQQSTFATNLRAVGFDALEWPLNLQIGFPHSAHGRVELNLLESARLFVSSSQKRNAAY